jgi:cytochrome P450
MYESLRDEDPAHHAVEGDYWVLSRFHDVAEAARDTETFSSNEGLTIQYGEREKLGTDVTPLVFMDPPQHTEFRKLVSKGFTPRRVVDVEPKIRDFVVQRIGRLCDAGTGDIAAELFKPLPSMVVAHYLGVPDQDQPKFDDWTDSIVAGNAGGKLEEVVDAVGEMMGYFAELVEYRKKHPGEDVVSDLTRFEMEGERVDLIGILGFAFTMVAGGNDTTTGLLGGASEILTRNPDQRRRLLDAPELLPRAVEEFLRLTSPVQGLARTTTRSVELHGKVIPKGKKVLLLYASGNLDEREFGANAGKCDVTRKIDKILTFGYGAHFCLGAAVARLQAKIALEELLARCPNYTVDYENGEYAEGPYVRRYLHLPFEARLA